MGKLSRETVITIAVAAVITMQGCSHSKKEVAATPEPVQQQVVAPETEDTDVLAEGKILNTIYFDFDKYSLQPAAMEELKKAAAYLAKKPETKIRVEGHCDERGTDEYNIALGERRAASARNYLLTLGVPSQNITTVSLGEERPAVTGHDEAAWAKNRRDELKVVK